MSVKVYIDGQEGTTGLKIQERFQGRNDVEIMKISEELRKDPADKRWKIYGWDFESNVDLNGDGVPGD